jgi:hypothetical protein
MMDVFIYAICVAPGINEKMKKKLKKSEISSRHDASCLEKKMHQGTDF